MVNASNLNIVGQSSHVIYEVPGDEALYAKSTTRIISIENKCLMDWRNTSPATTTYTTTQTVGFTTTTSKELSAAIKLGGAFTGVNVGGETGWKKTDTKAAQSSVTTTVQVQVPPHTSVWVYQRHYRLTTEIYFVLDIYGRLCRVMSAGGDHLLTAIIRTDIMANQFLTTEVPLTGTTDSPFATQQKEDLAGNYLINYENVTQRARRALQRLRIYGS